MSLPLPWVDRIFDKMTLTYGQHFLNRWRDLDLNAVKSDWMYELSGFEKAPHAIAFGLSNLPETAPTVVQFKNLCRQAPSVEVPALPVKPMDAEKITAVIAPLIERMSALPKTVDFKQWAKDILANPKGRTPTAIQMARNALENT